MPLTRDFVNSSEVSATITGPDSQMARRFSLNVAEEALQRMGPQVCQLVAERLAVEMRHEYQALIEDTVRSYLGDRAWAEPLIKQALREAVHAYVWGIFAPLGLGGERGEAP